MTFADERDPDFINDIGVKWWLDKRHTEHAQKGDANGAGFPDWRVFLTENKVGQKAWVVVDKDTPIHDDTTIEGLYFFIDSRKALGLAGS